MKTTGVIRRIDELGRIVIPKEIRRNLGIRDGENIEIFTDETSIILKKHSRIANYLDIISRIGDITNSVMGYSVIVTDREKVIFALGDNLDKINNKQISVLLKDLVDQRESKYDNIEINMNFENDELKGFFAVTPIIVSNDSIGLIIIFNKNKLSEAEIKYSKMFAKVIGEKIDIT